MCVWKVMADTFDFDDSAINELLYENFPIQKFMNARQSMGISACKGMGKTFLLKAKRMRLQPLTERESDALLLPKNQLVDTPGAFALNRANRRFLESYYNWVDLWVGCICIYLLSQDEIKSQFNTSDWMGLPEMVKELIDAPNIGVYHVLSRILSGRKRKVLWETKEAVGLLFALVQRIHRPIHLFVDKLEEPFNRNFYRIAGSSNVADGRYNASIWAYAQLSFAEAVYRLYSGQHHIKIYFGIRQEALIGAEHITQEASRITQSLITKLEYSYTDLQKMFAQYVQREKPENLLYPELADTDPACALCGISSIHHRSGTDENMWAYIHRHSLQRPRDIMEMGQTLYENIVRGPEELKTDPIILIHKCRHWINEISTRECMGYIAGLEPFMCADENIAFTQNILTFLRTLPTNMFTKETVLSYCHQSNRNPDKISCPDCPRIHSFSTLYNIGLLGCITKSVNGPNYSNKIKPIGDSIFTIDKQTLPDAALYYAHPGLGNIIKRERECALRFYTSSNFVINSSEVFVKPEQVKILQHFCSALLGNENDRRVFLTSTDRDLSDTRLRIKAQLEQAGYEVLGYEFENFPSMPAGGAIDEVHRRGETHDHCIDVMLSCKHLIYIFGGRFGGEYLGSNYAQYAEEYSNIIKIPPSVSFMEYLVAKRFGKNTKVYVLEKVDTARGEWIENGSKETYSSKVVDNVRVLKQLGYFNALGNGTWYDKYSNELMLERFIASHFPAIEETQPPFVSKPES